MYRKLIKVLRREGLAETIRRASAELRRRFRQPPVYEAEWDAQHGVETARFVWLDTVKVVGNNDVYGTHYQPIRSDLFHNMIGSLPLAHEQFTFVDIGSGKGRALMLAQAYPFKEIVGVEFSENLCAVARQNFVHYCGPVVCHHISCVCLDAVEYEFPRGAFILYLYNPFEAPVLTRVLANLQKDLCHDPREVWVAYYFPRERQCFENQNFLTRVQGCEAFEIYHHGEPTSRRLSAAASR